MFGRCTLLLRPTERTLSSLLGGVQYTCHKSRTHRWPESSDDFGIHPSHRTRVLEDPRQIRTGNWQTLQTTIEALYPSATTRYTKIDPEEFGDISAMSRVKGEGDVMLYYRRFLQMTTPLYNPEQLTECQRNAEFFEGLHIEDRNIPARRLYAPKPNHPLDVPWDFQLKTFSKQLLSFHSWYYSSILRDDQDRLREDPTAFEALI